MNFAFDDRSGPKDDFKKRDCVVQRKKYNGRTGFINGMPLLTGHREWLEDDRQTARIVSERSNVTNTTTASGNLISPAKTGTC